MPDDREQERIQRIKRLKARAERVLAGATVSEAVIKVRAIIGPPSIPETEPLAQAAMEALRDGEIPPDEELRALEIVIRLLRPVVLCREASLEALPHKGGHHLSNPEIERLWEAFREKVKPVIPSVGRIELTARDRHIGTGFLVRDGLLATNRHVLGALTFGAEFLGPGIAQVNFKIESGLPFIAQDRIPIEGVVAIHPILDMVLLKVPSTGRRPLDIAGASARETAKVVVLGHPGADAANNPLFLSQSFPQPMGVKRGSLGEVLDGTASPALYHDCSTTQGSSGSPIFDLTSGQVVGLHRSGFFMYRNEAIDADSLRTFIAAN
jgi:S1-C subfamily serine protease